jgi:hypothetical protein
MGVDCLKISGPFVFHSLAECNEFFGRELPRQGTGKHPRAGDHKL